MHVHGAQGWSISTSILACAAVIPAICHMGHAAVSPAVSWWERKADCFYYAFIWFWHFKVLLRGTLDNNWRGNWSSLGRRLPRLQSLFHFLNSQRFHLLKISFCLFHPEFPSSPLYSRFPAPLKMTARVGAIRNSRPQSRTKKGPPAMLTRHF